jgi:hypothetical protein
MVAALEGSPMRRIAALLPLLAIGAAPPAARVMPAPARVISPAPDCKQQVDVAQSPDGPIFRRLDELPPAQAYQAVYRLDANGCIDPLLVSDRIRQGSRGR